MSSVEHQPQETPNDEDEALPIASPVETPPELLERVRELEEQQNNIPHATPHDVTEDIEHQRRHRRNVGIFVASSFLAVLAILLGSLLGARNNNLNSPVDPTPSPTLSPEAEAVKALIESVSFDGGAALQNASSSQSMALEWLQQDNANTTETYEDWRLIQRYVLAVFYYSTSGDKWKENTDWLSGENECTWCTMNSDIDSPVCNETDGRYIDIDLEDNGLSGMVPVELALLSGSLRKYAVPVS